MDDPMLVLRSVPQATAKAVVQRLLRDPSKFSVSPSTASVNEEWPAAAKELFEAFATVQPVHGDLQLVASEVARVVVSGKAFWDVGATTEHAKVLLDDDGAAFEWDGQVLDGPIAPSLWHYVLLTAHVIYDEPLAQSP